MLSTLNVCQCVTLPTDLSCKIFSFPYYRLIRMSASDQFFYTVTKANSNTELLVSFISLLFSAVEVCVVGSGIGVLQQPGLSLCAQTVAKEHAPSSGEFFRLLSRMLNHAHHHGTAIQGVNKLLEVELNWLLKVRVCGGCNGSLFFSPWNCFSLIVLSSHDQNSLLSKLCLHGNLP